MDMTTEDGHREAKSNTGNSTAVELDPETTSQPTSSSERDRQHGLSTRRALWAWIILCFSTGPTSGMVNTYVNASIQSVANAVGHQPGTNRPCATKGRIECVVSFGGSEVDYLTYLLYLRAIGRAVEGLLSIVTAGAADFSNYRKPMMMASIYLFGILALPFAGLTRESYSSLNALSVLYVLSTVVAGIYTIIEASYIPIFMRSVAGVNSHQSLPHQTLSYKTWRKGNSVSVLGLVSSNVGSLVALLIGVIITYSRGSYVSDGYFDYLLAITIAGCLTIVFAVIGNVLLPSVPGRQRPAGVSIIALTFISWIKLLTCIRDYPNAFKFCVGWILWNTGYSNFLQLLGALFLETAGITSGSGIYTVYSFMTVIFACLGSLAWLLAFHRRELRMKTWAYVFLATNLLCVFWGCLGISDNMPIGYKHQAEFWVALFLFMSTSSALRSLNRALFASLIPQGSEALFFGLEITLDLATGWINPLVQAVIQDRTHNLRYPMLPNLFLLVAAICLYIWCDVNEGIRHATKPLAEKQTEQGHEVAVTSDNDDREIYSQELQAFTRQPI